MEKQNQPTLQPTLEEVRDKFESWRKIKRNHREPIPKDLWQAAADLARKYSVNTVSKELHLSYTGGLVVFKDQYTGGSPASGSYLERKPQR